MIANQQYLLMNYERGEKRPICQIGDEVIIHPVLGRSQATISYPAKIVAIKATLGSTLNKKNLTDKDKVLTLMGINDNRYWGGTWLNDYAFSRLEFVKRGK